MIPSGGENWYISSENPNKELYDEYKNWLYPFGDFMPLNVQLELMYDKFCLIAEREEKDEPCFYLNEDLNHAWFGFNSGSRKLTEQ